MILLELRHAFSENTLRLYLPVPTAVLQSGETVLQNLWVWPSGGRTQLVGGLPIFVATPTGLRDEQQVFDFADFVHAHDFQRFIEARDRAARYPNPRGSWLSWPSPRSVI